MMKKGLKTKLMVLITVICYEKQNVCVNCFVGFRFSKRLETIKEWHLE